MKKADDLYKERQYEQHHHQVHVPRSTLEERAYLEDLSKFSRDKLVKHASARHYLDTLSAGPKKSTWGLYRKQLGNTKQYLSVLPDEVDGELKVYIESLFSMTGLCTLILTRCHSRIFRFERRTISCSKSPRNRTSNVSNVQPGTQIGHGCSESRIAAGSYQRQRIND